MSHKRNLSCRNRHVSGIARAISDLRIESANWRQYTVIRFMQSNEIEVEPMYAPSD